MILVTGATGTVGGELVRTLVEAGEPVRALVRDPQKASFPDGVEVAVGDLSEPQSLNGALDGVRAVFLLGGFPDMPGVAKAIKDGGAERIVAITSGAAAGGDLTNAVERDQIATENAAKESGLAWTILRPSGFHSNALRWLHHLQAGDLVTVPWGDVKVASIDPADIAAVAALALTKDGHDGKTWRLTGPEPISAREQVAVLAEVLERPLTFENQSDEDARKDLEQALPAEYVVALFRFFTDGTYDDSKVLPTVKELTGKEPGTFRDWVVAHADAFR